MTRLDANKLKKGNYFVNDEDNQPYMVLDNEHSKSGKHGHAKNRISCVGLFNGRRQSLILTAADQVEIPEIKKRNGQIVDLMNEKRIAHVMDTESYETFECGYPIDEEDKVNLQKLDQLVENKDLMGKTQVEYWDVMGRRFITRVMIGD